MRLRYVTGLLLEWGRVEPVSRISFLDRERFVNYCLVVLAVISLPLVITSLLRSLQHGWHPIYYLHLGCFVALSSGALFRGHLSLAIRRVIILGVLFVASFVGLAIFGLVGGGLILFVMATAMAVLTLRLRGGLVALAIGAVAYVTIAVLVTKGYITHAVEPDYALSSSAWVAVGFDAIFSAFVIVVSFGRARSEMEASFYALQQNEKYLKQAEALAGLGHWRLDVGLGTIRGSDEFYHMVGLTPEETTLEIVTQMFFPSAENQSLAAINEAIKKGLTWNEEHHISLLSGEEKVVHSRGEAVREDGGRAVMLIGTVQDITDRKRQEEEKRLLQEQLLQAEKLQAIGQLAGGVAHDFNNQLTGITGFADLIERRLASKKDWTYAEYARQVLTSAERSSDLIGKLLAFARKGKNLEETVNVHSVIEEVVSILGRSIDKRVLINRSLESEPCTTLGDPSQLQSALLNLGINARDAMPEGGELAFSTTKVTVMDDNSCNLLVELGPGDYIKVSVGDTGIGIEESIRTKIFDPFFTTKPAGKGTGMGLSAVYGAVREHGGAIEMETEKDVGTTFHVYLPLGTKETTTAKETSGYLPAKTMSKLSRHIVVVDDESVVLEVVTGMLCDLGYKASIFQKGLDAVEFLRRNWSEVDLVVLDVVMPEMGAENVYLALKKINPALKVLLFSGYSCEGDARKLIEMGADGFLQKPFRESELQEKIEEILCSNEKKAEFPSAFSGLPSKI